MLRSQSTPAHDSAQVPVVQQHAGSHFSDRYFNLQGVIFAPAPPSYLPHLRELFVSHPRKEDQLWGLIPDTLEHLALLCHPHYNMYGHTELEKTFWMSPIPADDLLSIFREMNLSNLHTLRLAFWADDSEQDEDWRVLQYVSRHCPQLESLDIHRNHDKKKMHAEDLVITVLF